MPQNYKLVIEDDILGTSFMLFNANDECLRSNFFGPNEPIKPIAGQRWVKQLADGTYEIYRFLPATVPSDPDYDETVGRWIKDDWAFREHNHDGRYSLIDHNHDDRYALIDHTHVEFEILPELVANERPIGTFIFNSFADEPRFRRCDGGLCLFENYTRLRDKFLAGGLYPSANMSEKWWRYYGEFATNITFNFNDLIIGYIDYDGTDFSISRIQTDNTVWRFGCNRVNTGLNKWEFTTTVNTLAWDSEAVRQFFIPVSQVLESSSSAPNIPIAINKVLGLYTPDFRNVFLRSWDYNQSIVRMGYYEKDAEQLMQGCIGQIRSDLNPDSEIGMGWQTNPFYNNGRNVRGFSAFQNTEYRDFMLAYFDNSRSVRTDVETRPENVRVAVLVYVGE